MDMGRRKRLGREDWTGAALQALREGGLAAIAVEPLAARLSATKGSFYWHFRDREALVTAALERWEHDETDQVVEGLAAVAGAAQRLELLVDTVLVRDQTPDLSVPLLADAGHPAVAAALERVTRRRIDYLTEQFLALGVERREAEHRALLAYTAFLGLSQLRRFLPALAPGAAEIGPYAALLRRVLEPA
jgi:AcrR family transcriptional regulator